MAKTKFVNGSTVVTSDFLNSVFGGLSAADGVSASDVRVTGHVHDGGNSDGHVGKIDLGNHVTGQLDTANIADQAVTAAKLDPSITFGGDYILNPEKIVLGMTNTGPVQLGVDANGDLTGTATTITFSTPSEDVVIKQIICNIIGYDANFTDASVDKYTDIAKTVGIEEMRVNGIAIASSGVMFMGSLSTTRFNHLEVNIALAAGDTFEIDVPASSVGSSAYSHFSLLCEPGTTTDGDYSFIGLQSSYAIVTAATDNSTLDITINTNPIANDQSIVFNPFFEDSGDYILYSANGARTPGSDDFDNTLGSSSLIAAEIAAAINDSNNSFDDIGFSASASTDTVTITYPSTGYYGNLTKVSHTYSTDITVSNYFSGGSRGSLTTVTFEAAAANCILKNIYLTQFSNDAIDASYTMSVESVKINGGTNLISGVVPLALFSPSNGIYSPNFNVAMSAGDVITMEIRNSIITGILIGHANVELT